MKSGIRILLLEDTASDAELIEITLMEAGVDFVSLRVETREAFSHALEDFHPDIILSDFSLPSFDGRTALAMVQKRCPAIPMLMVTGAIGDELAVELLKAGARDYVLKDRLARLPSAVHRALAEAEEIRQREATERALRESEEKFRTMTASAQDAIILVDSDARVCFWNAAAERIFGYPKEEALGQDLFHLAAPEQLATDYEDIFRRFRNTGSGTILGDSTELRARRRDGSEFHLEASVSGLFVDGRWHAIGIARDITERKRAEAKLRQAQRVFDHTAEGIVVTDAEANIVAVNKAFTEITGYEEAEVLDRNCRMLKSGQQDAFFYKTMWASLTRAGVWTGEIWNRRKNGEVYSEWLAISAVEDEYQQPTHYVGVFSDTTAIKKSQAAVDFLAHHDALTELPNRLLCKSLLEHAVDRAHNQNNLLAVLFINLDRFKSVNESLGHPAGDQLLRIVSRRMKEHLRSGDTLARMGGDEFTVILEQETSVAGIAALATKFAEALARPLRIEDHDLHVTASIGVCVYPEDGEDADTLLRNADLAMDQAKTIGRNTFQFFTASLAADVRERLALENALHGAIERNELMVYYQPQVDLSNGRMIGVEALARWQHPELGWVPPTRFIPIAEEMGIVRQIGVGVLQRACRQMREWRDKGFVVPRVAVNLSVRQIEQDDLLDVVRNALADSGLAAECLELEVTESLIMKQPEKAAAVMAGLRDLGVILAIDDFGTGYSSLSYLKKLPLHRLKIDYSFVRDINHDLNDEAIVRTVISLAGNLGLEVLAEGIERDEQASWLLREGCRFGQGYLFGRPVPPEELLQSWIARHTANQTSPLALQTETLPGST
jgi:diguanylate cyclase (GGDEF)-like protein/PAS domain S-box-containing protein